MKIIKISHKMYALNDYEDPYKIQNHLRLSIGFITIEIFSK
jgi:hypothetical protein